MALSVRDSRVDWGWNQRSASERATIRRWQPLLDESDHTPESFMALLGHATEALEGVEVRAIIEDDTGALTLLLSQNGAVDSFAVSEASRPEHRRIVSRLMVSQKADLCPAGVSARERAEVAAGKKLDQDLFFPEPILEEIQKEALRTDRSVSYVVQHSFAQTRDRIRALSGRNEAARHMRPQGGAPQKKQTIFFPAEMLVEIEEQAERFHVSLSWVVQLAWALFAG